MKVSIEKGMLVIRIPANTKSPALSATQKTRSVASSHGNKETDLLVKGLPVYVGINAYIYAKPKGSSGTEDEE
jgi:hypothetical protein